MKRDMAVIGRRVVVGVVLIAAAVFFVSKILDIFFWTLYGDTRRMCVRLLYETDHQALLKACRQLSRWCITGDLKPGTYVVRRHPDPEVSRFPQPILDLAPSFVHIDESGCVTVEMLGGLGHFGVKGYPEDYKYHVKGHKYGDKELVPGLWYYDDGYNGHPEYEKRIEALRPKGAKQGR